VRYFLISSGPDKGIAMRKKVRFNTKRLTIRTLIPVHVAISYVRGLNDPEINRYLVNVRLRKQSLKSVKEFVRMNLVSPTDLLLGLFTKYENVLIGTIRVSNISRFHLLCSIGICIFDKSRWGNGYGGEALIGTVKYIFEKIHLHYIEAGVYADNKASLRLFRKAGFRVDAHLKNKYRHADSFREVVLFGIENPDWKRKRLR